MLHNHAKLIVLMMLFCIVSITLWAQAETVATAPQKQPSLQKPSPLFESDSVLHLKLSGKLNDLFNDRKEDIKYHPLLLEYEGKEGNKVFINLKAKARGNFRRLKANCKLPPILLNFPKDEKINKTVFANQDKLKLVMPCQGDEYVVREYLVYKIYNILTDKSFKARLVMVNFEDSLGERKPESFYCILIEDENDMAERNNATLLEKRLQMENTKRSDFTRMAVFEYLIANTDWSVPFLQNIKLISPDSMGAPYTVPYDFDHAGIVGAPYAGVAPELEISSTRERIYRGYCNTERMDFIEAFELFNKKKNEIYNLYTSNSELDPRYVKFVVRFLDEFYKTIDRPKSIEQVFNAPCRTNVRVELKGLKD